MRGAPIAKLRQLTHRGRSWVQNVRDAPEDCGFGVLKVVTEVEFKALPARGRFDGFVLDLSLDDGEHLMDLERARR